MKITNIKKHLKEFHIFESKNSNFQIFRKNRLKRVTFFKDNLVIIYASLPSLECPTLSNTTETLFSKVNFVVTAFQLTFPINKEIHQIPSTAIS